MSRGCGAALPRGSTGLPRFVIVVFPDHTHLLFLYYVLLSLLNVIKISKRAPSHTHARARADSVCVKKCVLGQISLNDDYLNANQLNAISWGIIVND